jgi:hypothetical protein
MPRESSARRSNAPSPPTLSEGRDGDDVSSQSSNSDAALSGCVDDSTLGQADSDLMADSRDGNAQYEHSAAGERATESQALNQAKRLCRDHQRHTTEADDGRASSSKLVHHYSDWRRREEQARVTAQIDRGVQDTREMDTPASASMVRASIGDAWAARATSYPPSSLSMAPERDGYVETAIGPPQYSEHLGRGLNLSGASAVNRMSSDDNSMANGTSTSTETTMTGTTEIKSLSRPRFELISIPDSLSYLRLGRAGHAMVAVDSRVYLFGGYRVSVGEPHPGSLPPPRLYVQTPTGRNRFRIYFGDLVAFDSETRQWCLLSSIADIHPTPRRHASMVCFAGALYLYGGFDASNQVLGDLWRFDLSMERRWVLISCVDLNAALRNMYEHPPPSLDATNVGMRAASVMEHANAMAWRTSATVDGVHRPGRYLDDFPGLQSTAQQDVNIPAPGERISEGHPDQDIVSLGPLIRLPAGGPSPGRAEHTAVVYRHFMVIFGGFDGRRKVNTVALVDLRSGLWFCPRVLQEIHKTGRPGLDYPHRRCKHTAIVHGNKMYVLGGFQYRNKFNYACSDLFVLDLETWTWQGPVLMHGDGPQAIQGHCAVACLDAMYIFGGKIRMRQAGDVAQPGGLAVGNVAPQAATGNDISPTPPELRSSGLNADIWEYRFDMNKWRRITLRELTEASLGQHPPERMRLEPEPRQLAGLAIVAEQNPSRCTIYLFGGMNRSKDRFYGDMYAFYGLGSDTHRSLQPCRLCAGLGKALNDPSLADVIFTVAEHVDNTPIRVINAWPDSIYGEVAQTAPAPPATSTADIPSPSSHRGKMPTLGSSSSDRDEDVVDEDDQSSSEQMYVGRAQSPEGHRMDSFPSHQSAPMRHFYAHRVILASRSEYFANMFRAGLWESGQGRGPRVIHLPGISARVFEAVLHYLYTGELHYPSSSTLTHGSQVASPTNDRLLVQNHPMHVSEDRGHFMLELLSAADMLRLDHLRDLCVAQVEQAIRPENVAFVLELAAQSQDGMGGLKSYCLAYIIHHFSHVIQTVAWQNLLRRDPAGLGREVLQTYYESTTSTAP